MAFLVAATAAHANAKVYLACGTAQDPTPPIRRVARRSCVIRAYSIDIFQYVHVELRTLRWHSWGSRRARARGQYGVDGGGWQPASLTARQRQQVVGKIPGVFYLGLQVVDTCRCGFIGPSRGFTLDITPNE